MKKTVCILVLSCVIMGAAFAQQKTAAPAEESGGGGKNAVAFDIFPLLNGFIASESVEGVSFTEFAFAASYERLLVPHFSFGGNLDLYYLNISTEGQDYSGYYFSMAGEGRYYPMSDFDKLFLGTTLGFNVLSVDGKTGRADGGFVGLTTSLKMGYKVMIKSFYLEPSLAYVLSKASIGDALFEVLGTSLTPKGWTPGLRLGFTF